MGQHWVWREIQITFHLLVYSPKGCNMGGEVQGSNLLDHSDIFTGVLAGIWDFKPICICNAAIAADNLTCLTRMLAQKPLLNKLRQKTQSRTKDFQFHFHKLRHSTGAFLGNAIVMLPTQKEYELANTEQISIVFLKWDDLGPNRIQQSPKHESINENTAFTPIERRESKKRSWPEKFIKLVVFCFDYIQIVIASATVSDDVVCLPHVPLFQQHYLHNIRMITS